MSAEWRENGDVHAETVAMLEDQIATLEGVQTQHQVLLDKIFELTKKAVWEVDNGRATEFASFHELTKEIQELIEENA